jgi:hypothetical protein
VISLPSGWLKPLSCVRMSMGPSLLNATRPRKMPRGFVCQS